MFCTDYLDLNNLLIRLFEPKIIRSVNKQKNNTIGIRIIVDKNDVVGLRYSE